MTATEYGPLSLWGMVVALGVATYALRYSFIYLLGRVENVPEPLTRALRYVPPAVFAALVAPSFVVSDGAVALGVGNTRLLAGVAAAAVAWYAENVFATIAAGLAAFWFLRFGV
jgi:branched-subunit amino acid transport protein